MFNITSTTTSRQKVARLSRLLYQSPTGKKKTTATHDATMNVLPMATIGNTNSTVVTQRCLSSTMTSQASASSSSSSYVSPYQDLFEMMKDSSSSSKTNNSSSCASTFLPPSSSTSTPLQTNIPRLQCGIPETVLKFRTTCYDRLMLAPYVQPSEYKVILQVQMKHLPLETHVEKEIFYQIVGTRFNHDSQELKLTSNQFASRIENKRHLCWMLDRIVMGAKNLARDSYR